MCFSASASFTASFLLLIIGILTMRRVKQQRLYYIAAIPLFFSIQQAAEGVVWLSLLGYTSTTVQHIATYIFLIFALGIWPFWIPFSVMKGELHPAYKRLLKSCTIFGAITMYLLTSRLFQYGAQASVANCHISYNYIMSQSKISQMLYLFNYIFFITFPFFYSTIAYMKYFGLGVLASCLISFYFYSHNFTSVWCFFAALLSMGIYFIIDQEQLKNKSV